MSLPTYTVRFRGKPACPCLAEWLPVYEAELQRRGTITGELRIYQLIGGADASAGTHSKGGAFDITDLVGEDDVWVARQMGADATWARGAPFIPHLHGVLRGCPHNGPAAYQIDAVDDGFNGLGSGGRGARDDGPRPLSGRTWRQGIEWARQQGDFMATDEAKSMLQQLLDQGDASKRRDVAHRRLTKANGRLLTDIADALEDDGENTEAIKRRVTKSKVEVLAAIDELVELEQDDGDET